MSCGSLLQNQNDSSHSISVHVEQPPPKDRLDVVYTRTYAIDSPFWNERAKVLIVDWIPSLHSYVRADGHTPPCGAMAVSIISSKPAKQTGESHTVNIKGTCLRTPGYTRQWSRCASP